MGYSTTYKSKPRNKKKKDLQEFAPPQPTPTEDSIRSEIAAAAGNQEDDTTQGDPLHDQVLEEMKKSQQ